MRLWLYSLFIRLLAAAAGYSRTGHLGRVMRQINSYVLLQRPFNILGRLVLGAKRVLYENDKREKEKKEENKEREGTVGAAS